MSQTVKRTDGDEPEYSFGAVVSVDVLADYLDRINAVFDDGGECRIHLESDGIWSKVVDPANVCMVDLSLDTSAFESYDAPASGESVVGVDIDRLQDMLGVAGKGELVRLRLNAETRKLDLSFPNVGVEFELALIDPDSIRQEPDLPELDLPVECVFEASWLQRGAKVADMVGEYVTIATDADGDPRLRMEGAGDTDSGITTIGPDAMIDGSASADAESIFSLGHLTGLCKVFRSDDELTIELGTEFPVTIGFEFADGAGEGTYVLAPRIQSQ